MTDTAVQTQVHHNPTGPAGRPWMVVFSDGHVLHLTDDEKARLRAQLSEEAQPC